jgi:Zn-dependent peptidase ImmA (M78 family)/fido (protein-threonine AMPylation protein)
MSLSKINISPYIMTPEELASKVLQEFNKLEPITYPIDPFIFLSKFGVVYKFQNFEDLEGVYIVPSDEQDLPIVGINNNRPITRQRFTAAHELCHHIKDKGTQYCPLDGRKTAIEKYADQFAANLLMPIDELDQVSSQYLKNGWIDFENAIYIADYFGVSFQACIYRLAYTLKRISGEVESSILKARIKEFKPDKQRISLGINKYELPLMRNIINNHSMFYENENDITWLNFKNNFVYNENRLEGIELDIEVISEIIADLRLAKQESEFCKSEFSTLIEVAGHSSLFDYVSETTDNISVFSLLRLHQIMYQYSKFPENTGKFREVNNLVINSKFDTCDYSRIITELMIVEKEVVRVINNKENQSIVDYIDAVVRIHHRLTQIHPFMDGNGRITRGFLNWMFRKKNLPPVYIKAANKFEYFDALSIADLENNYGKLYEIFYREIIKSLIDLNEKYRWEID